METNENLENLQWGLQLLQSGNLDLQSLSFFLSHPTSGCLQQTEISINIYISDDGLLHLSQLLQAVTGTGLTNLEFHTVDWDLQALKTLALVLQSNPSIKQLVFRRNSFGPECLSELSDALRRDDHVREITVSESCIGPTGAALLASALKENRAVEQLQIWEDSIGFRGAEELSKMIEVNSTLKLLTIFDSKSVTATPLISAVVGRNRSMEVHIWSSAPGRTVFKVVEFVPESSSLRAFHLDVGGACRLAVSLGCNSTVRSLDLTGTRLNSRWAREFRWVLEQNRCLKEVNLSNTCLKDKGAVYVAAGLFKNRTLEKLYIDGNRYGGVGVEHLLCPVTKFSTLQKQANVSLRWVTIGGNKTKIGRNGVAAIVQMLTTNETLTHLGIHDDESLKPDDVVRIFRSLERNANLRSLSLQGCRGVKGELVLQAIMDTLNVNPWIEDIDLVRTPLHASGKSQGVNQRLTHNGRDEPDVDLGKEMEMTMPRSCRVFLCGQDYAGKTTLCDSILQNISPSKLLDQMRSLVNPVEHAVKTPGIQIRTFKDDDIKISLWNLSGQHETFSPHDLMFPGPGSASLFLIISSLCKKPGNRELKTSNEVEQDLHYWLRFIVSNLKHSVQHCMLPCVTVVLTHHDSITQPSDNSQAVVTSIQRLRDKFHGVVEFYPTVFTVDARSSASVNKLSHHVRKTCKTILERVPRVYQLCHDLVHALSDWIRVNHNKPAMRWKELEELCQIKVPSLRIRSRNDNKDKVESRRRAVASSLHNMGEVIYFNEMDFLILDCEWFFGEVLSQLVRLDLRKQSSTEKGGFICRKDFEKILVGTLKSHIPGMGSNVIDNLEPEDLIKLMLKFELCCEQEQSNPNSSLLVPSNLEDSRWKPQRWLVNTLDSNYVGRRLQCHDSDHMFLTPGFFRRLQVHLHNKVMGLKNQHGASCSLEKYIIQININGIHVRVELVGGLGYCIELLACSTKSPTEILRLFHHLIIPAMDSLCQGITTLTEHAIRSECVKNLIPPGHRRSQSVHLQKLKQALLSVPADGIYDYQHTWESIPDSGSLILGPGFDFARDLLSDDDFREVLHSRYHDLYNLAMELHVPQENDPNSASVETGDVTGSVEPTFAGIAKGVETVLQRLKIIEQEIRDVKQEIRGLRYYEHRLLLELQRKMNYLVNYNVQLEERKVPNMFYFVGTENYSRRLITSMISGMTALRLHMLCEFRREMHVVEDQIGCELMQVDNITVKYLAPYMKKFMKLVTFALKIGAHLAVGMGEMIPDLGREVAHLIESPMFIGAAAAGAAGAAAAVGNQGRRSRDIQEDHRAAQQWVVDFLREQRCSTGKDIAEKFGLWRVRYRDDGQIAWVCRRHMHARAYEIIEVPN